MGLPRNEIRQIIEECLVKYDDFFSRKTLLEKKKIFAIWEKILSQDENAEIMERKIPNGKQEIIAPFVYSQHFYSNGEPVPIVTKADIEENIRKLKEMRNR